MVFSAEMTARVLDSYGLIRSYFADLRRFYEIVGTRLGAGEYGTALESVTGDRRLFSSVDSYRLPQDTARSDPGGPECLPAYIWFPTWLGSFYSSRSEPVFGNPLVFVWTWIGADDAFVAPVSVPECWIGVASYRDFRSAKDAALQTWRSFRLEWTVEAEEDQWLTGRFDKDVRNSNLLGQWHLRRIPITSLSSFYDLEKKIIQPLSERFMAERADHIAPSSAHLQRFDAAAQRNNQGPSAEEASVPNS